MALSSVIAVGNIEPGDKSWLWSQVRHQGVSILDA